MLPNSAIAANNFRRWPNENANLLKIRSCQIAKYLDINIVVDKRRRVPLQANLRQPFRNLPHERPRADLQQPADPSAYQF
jgi:hypothetical protein